MIWNAEKQFPSLRGCYSCRKLPILRELNWQTYLYLWRGCRGCQELPIWQNIIRTANGCSNASNCYNIKCICCIIYRWIILHICLCLVRIGILNSKLMFNCLFEHFWLKGFWYRIGNEECWKCCQSFCICWSLTFLKLGDLSKVFFSRKSLN